MAKSKYGKLLSTSRFRETEVKGRSVLLEAESDRGRLLYCPAFRRLQQKAQVFSLESNAAVRSRLTHSLEVSQTGRHIADEITINLIERNLATEEQGFAIVTFVETACLMHDIGNPPFGHFGEAAISEWFRKNGPKILRDIFWKSKEHSEEELRKIDSKNKRVLSDFWEFDGNPQGLRVVTKLQRNSDEYGLNLTKTVLASYLKYVRGTHEERQSPPKPFTKKAGYFQTEKELIIEIRNKLTGGRARRFPLAYIMEAADDIAYCISDLEDSIEKKLVNKKQAFSDLLLEWQNNQKIKDKPNYKEIEHLLKNTLTETNNEKPFTYTDFRTNLNRLLVKKAVNNYLDNHKSILRGEIDSLIPSDSSEGEILELLKSYCRRYVYCHISVQKTELAGYKAITGLLDNFRILLECDHNRFQAALDYDSADKSIIIEKKYLTLFPKNYKDVYLSESRGLDYEKEEDRLTEWNLRAHLITDFIAGMTDDFSLEMYQSLSGIKL